jgi:hypothetical protein
MRWSGLASVAIALIVVAGCRGAGASPAGAPQVASGRASEDRAVYAAVLRELYGGEAPLPVVDPVADAFPWGAAMVRESLPEVPADAVAALVRARRRAVPPALADDLPVAWQADRPGGPSFGDTTVVHSTGRVELSPIGFSQDGRFAVVHAMRTCGPLSATGRIVLLERVDGAWRVRRAAPTLAS